MAKAPITLHQELARNGTAPRAGSMPSKRFYGEGGFVKTKQMSHLVHGARHGFKQMPKK